MTCDQVIFIHYLFKFKFCLHHKSYKFPKEVTAGIFCSSRFYVCKWMSESRNAKFVPYFHSCKSHLCNEVYEILPLDLEVHVRKGTYFTIYFHSIRLSCTSIDIKLRKLWGHNVCDFCLTRDFGCEKLSLIQFSVAVAFNSFSRSSCIKQSISNRHWALCAPSLL